VPPKLVNEAARVGCIERSRAVVFATLQAGRNSWAVQSPLFRRMLVTKVD